MQTDALIEGMNALGYRVSNVSPVELGHGYDVFLERQESAEFELISANLVWQDDGEPIVEPTAIFEVDLRKGARTKRSRIGFMGLSTNDPAFMAETSDGRRIVTVDPLIAAAKYLPALLKKSDVVVALVSLDIEEARRLPKKVKGIDLVLGGSGPRRTRDDDFPEDTKFGRTRLMYIGHQGQHVGELRLVFNPDGGLVSTKRATLQLTQNWPDEPVLAELVEKTTIAVNDYNRTQAEDYSPFASARPPSDVDGAPSSRVTRSTAVGPGYTGSERCATCHEKEYAIWSESRHAHAFDVLVSANQDFNSKCVGCHTVGFRRSEGFVNLKATPELIHVGCESCHGPSGDHPDRVAAGGYGGTDTGACTSCHTSDNSPEFDPSTYIPKILHWGEERSSR